MKTYKILLVLFSTLRFSSWVKAQWIVQHSGLAQLKEPYSALFWYGSKNLLVIKKVVH